jgi:polyisoprenyl-teichoic acid--peptidoglycan teichoic acid transferase
MADPPKRKPGAKRKAQPKKPSARKPAPKSKGRASKPSGSKPKAAPPPDQTQEYRLDEDFLDDIDAGKALDETQEQPLEDLPPAADEPLGEEELPEPDQPEPDRPEEDLDQDELAEAEEELTQIISAETREWDGLEAAEQQGREEDAEAERTLVGAVGAAGAKARSAITSGFEAVGGQRITSGFKAVAGRARFPIWARFLTAALVIVASVGTATAASLLLYIGDIAGDLKLDPEFESIEQRLETVDGGEPQTILILGSDKRPEFKNNKFRGLSDTTMLLRVDPDRNAVALFSLPRDLKVDIPGYGTAKLNEAYFAGGPELTLRTIQGLTKVPATDNQGLEVNHIVNVDFEGFARAVNAIDCVYIDVDRRYYHSNEESVEQYEEIDIQPGYQALCGFDALDYARFRHLDNDVVRAARQQDFLREARHKVPPEVVFAQRRELIDIFTEHTTSDIDTKEDMLEVLKLFIEARDAPVKEVHFEGTLGPSFVFTTPEEINTAVEQFLGIQDTPGARADTAQPEDPNRDVMPEAAPDDTATPSERDAAKRRKQKERQAQRPDANLVETSFGKELAKGIRSRKVKLPIYYPTVLEEGTDYAQKPRVYKINGTGDGSPPNGQRAAYKWVFSRPALGEYYGFMATRWEDPPILDAAHDEREIDGRTYKLYYDGDRLRMVAWQDDNGSFWLSNTLIQSLSDREMIDIAKGMTELPKRGQRG